MDTIIFEVENIKCGGCANSIKKELLKINNNVFIGVDVEEGKIKITGIGELDRDLYIKRLSEMGYSERGKGNIIDRAKSYVSCMIGKLG